MAARQNGGRHLMIIAHTGNRLSLGAQTMAAVKGRLASIALSLILLCSGLLSAFPISTASVAADSVSGLHVSANKLYRNGQPYLPRGFNSIGLLSPAWCKSGQVAAAHFGQAEMDAAKKWNANTLRFQISQRGLADPTIAQSDRDAYLTYVEAGVALARSNGFTVILSMQDQSIGCGPAHPLPFDQTAAAWSVLAPPFMNDQNVMFELFNEPQTTNSPAGWNQWANGGTTPVSDQGATPIGHQQLINQIRGLGAPNVIIAEGLNGTGQLLNMIPLSDPTGQLMYGIHTYSFGPGQKTWDADYGNASATYPVIATEWNYQSTDCGTKIETLAPSFLQYLKAHNIGLLGHALDVPGTPGGVYDLITSDWTWTPTNCATAQGGSGQVMKDYFSAQTDATDTIIPAAPSSLSAAISPDGHVALNWQPGSDNIAVTGYQIQRNGSPIATVNSLNYSDSTASPATTYTYTVTALDAAGNASVASNSAMATTLPDTSAPSTPGNVSAQAVGPTEVTVSWSASSDDTAVTGYQVWRDGTMISQINATSYDDTTAMAGTTYSYAIAAVDAAGNAGLASIPVQVTTPPVIELPPPDITPPSVPTQLSAPSTSQSEVDLSWAASSDDTGVTGYQVWRDGVLIGWATTSSFADTTVQPDGTYSYSVVAYDAANNLSDASVALSVTTPPATELPPPDTTPPTAPANLTATVIGQNQDTASLSWQASTDDTAVTGYQVWRDGTMIAATTDTDYTDGPLAAATTHAYAVTAIDAAGNVSDPSSAAQLTIPDVSPPSAPLITFALQNGQSQVNLTWQASSDNIGVTGYTIWRNGSQLAQTSGTNYTDPNVSVYATYSYVVTAADAAGNSNSSAAAQVIVADVTAPSAPSGLAAQAVSPTQVNLSWQPASDNVGVTTYQVQRNGAILTRTTGLTYSDTTASPATAYSYTVTAFDAAGNGGPASGSANTTTPALDKPPTAPGSPAAQLVTPTKVTLTWKAGTDDEAISGYRVVRDGTTLTTTGKTVLTYSDTTMAVGSHSYVMYTIDSAGQVSPASKAAIAVVPVNSAHGLTGQYYANTGLTGKAVLTRVDSTINFAWGSASPGSGVPKTNYSVNWNGEIIPLTNETYTFTLASDDGARMWINGQQVINDWNVHALKQDKFTIALSSNQAYSVQIQYFEATGSATAKLSWSTPTIATQIVPSSQLLSK